MKPEHPSPVHEVMSHRDFSSCTNDYRCTHCNDVFENTQQLSLHSQLAHKIDNTQSSEQGDRVEKIPAGESSASQTLIFEKYAFLLLKNLILILFQISFLKNMLK